MRGFPIIILFFYYYSAIFLIINLPFNVNSQWIYDFAESDCNTPNNRNGNCVEIRLCNPMLDVLKSLKRPISASILKQIQAYSCRTRSDNSGTKVCCPSEKIILQNDEDMMDEQPPVVSEHRNLNLLPSNNCGFLNSDNRILNGENAALNEFPWMALLRYRKRNQVKFGCGGTIISENYILTAAHCLIGSASSELISVRVGEHSIKNATDCETVRKIQKCNPPFQDLKIEQIIVHPKFTTDTLTHDIALIRVSSINFDAENTKPVCLPLGKERTRSLESIFVAGWGVSNASTGESSDVLQKVRLRVTEKNSCLQTYQTYNIKLTNSQICAGGIQNKDSCKGDSGGPAMVPSINENSEAIYVQHGIVSFGPRICGISGFPGIYTAVSYFMDWILANMRP